MTNSIPLSEFVTDTIGLVLHLERRRSGVTAKSIFEAAEAGNAIVHIPALVFAEILYLSERQRISVTLNTVSAYIGQHPRFRERPMSLATIRAAAEITDVRELHDRLIAGTARALGLPLVTNDSALEASAFVRTVW